MGKQFGTGVTIKPFPSKENLERIDAEMKKKYAGKKLVYSSCSYSSLNIQAGHGVEVPGDQFFDDVKDALKRLGFNIAERKEGNKRYILIKE